MSDSEHSTVTYTSISSDYEEPSDVGSPRVVVYGYDGLPMHPPSPDYVPGPEHPPSPDYVPGPEHPPSPVYVPYVPEPAYPEFMPPEDDVFPAEEQPLPAAVSPTADSPGYITESDPEEDPEEEDDKDPEEDSTDYPADRDDEEEEESTGDDADDEEEDEEEEHLASVDSVPPPACRTTARMSIRAQTPIPFSSEAEVDRLLAIPTLPPSPLTPLSSPLPQIPSPPFPGGANLNPAPLPLPPPIILPHTRASMVMIRVVASSTYILAPRSETPPSWTPPLLPIPLPTSSPPLLLPSTDCRANVPEVTLLPWKRLCIAPGPRYEIGECSSAPTARPTRDFRADYGFVGTLDAEIRRDPDREIGYGITDIWEDPDEIAEEIPTTDVAELGQRLTDFVTTVRQDTDEIYGRLDDAQDDRLLMSGQLNLLRRDRCSHARMARLMESEARASCEAWTQMVALQSQQRPARDPTHPDVPEEAGSSS
ncbi:hypothetical protein Tco_1329207 [Tanacetum coccineum]